MSGFLSESGGLFKKKNPSLLTLPVCRIIIRVKGVDKMKDWFFKKRIFRLRGKARILYENPPMAYSELQGDDILSCDEVQRRLKRGWRQVYRYVSDGRLKPLHRDGKGYPLLFRKKEVEKFVKSFRRGGD